MQSFLSTSKGADAANTQSVTLNTTTFDKSLLAKLETVQPPKNIIIVADSRTLVIKASSQTSPIKLEAQTDVFHKNLQSATKYLVATTTKKNVSALPPSLLAVIKPLNVVVSPPKQGNSFSHIAQTSKPVTILPSANSTISLPVTVLSSNANAVIVKPHDSKTINIRLPNSITLPVDNPKLRPLSGKSVWLDIQIKPDNSNLLISWAETKTANKLPLANIEQNGKTGNILKTLMLSHKEQAIDITKKLYPKDIQLLPLDKTVTSAVGKISENKLAVHSQRLIAVAQITPSDKQQFSTLKEDITVTKKQFSDLFGNTKLPVLAAKTISKHEELQLAQKAFSKLTTHTQNKSPLHQTIPSELSNFDVQKLNESIRNSTRQLVAKGDGKATIGELLSVDRKQPSNIEPKPIETTQRASSLNGNLPSKYIEALEKLLKPALSNNTTAVDLKQSQQNSSIISDEKNARLSSDAPKKPVVKTTESISTYAKQLKETTQFQATVDTKTKSNDSASLEESSILQRRLANEIRQTVSFPLLAISPTTIQNAIQQTAPNSLASALLRVLTAITPTKTVDQTAFTVQRERHSSTKATTPQNRPINNQSANNTTAESILKRQIFSNLINHQLNKLSNADSALNGQEQIYYALPTVGEIKTPTEFLIKPINEEENENTKGEAKNKSWQLTLKLGVGELGTILASSTINETELNVDLYAEDHNVLRLLEQSKAVFEERLRALGLPTISVSTQMGVIPDTLKPRSLHLLETRV